MIHRRDWTTTGATAPAAKCVRWVALDALELITVFPDEEVSDGLVENRSLEDEPSPAKGRDPQETERLGED